MRFTAIFALFLLCLLRANAKTLRHDIGHCTGLVQVPEGVFLRPQLCNLLKQYEHAHLKAIHSQETASSNKFLVLDMEQFDTLGLGNRLPDVVAGFVMAMFLNRTFLYALPKASQETFQDRLGYYYPTSATLFESVTQIPILGMGFLQSMNDKFWEPTENEHVLYFPITWGGNWLAHFQANPHMTPFLQQHFPDYEVFHPLSHYLFPLSHEASQIVKEVHEKQFRPLTIGVQVRMLKVDWQKWGAAYGAPKLENYFILAKQLQLESGVHESNTTFFIAGDKPEVYEAAAKQLPGHVYHTENGVGKEFTNQKGINPGTELSATVDMKLLSLCDILLVTWGSSYGQVAAAWGGIKSYIITGREVFDDGLPWYFAQASTEPCHWPANDMAMNPEEWQAFLRNPLWMHHTQCHPCSGRKNCRNPNGDRVKAEKVQFVRSILLNSTWEESVKNRRHLMHSF